jgi:DNA-binding transcriptional MerR regulator
MTNQKNDLLTASGLAAATGIPQLTIRNWARRGLIPFRLDSTGKRIFNDASIARAKELRSRTVFKLVDAP